MLCNFFQPTCSKPEGTDAALVSQEMPSCSNSHKLNRSISRIKNAASNVTRKLQQKKCSLQKQNVDIMVDEKETRKNDERVRAILNDLRIDKNMSEKQLHVNGYKTSNEDMPINANIAMSSKPLHQHSKKQLECLVEGLQELVRKLTMDDNTLKLKAQRLADNINGLKDFPLFYLDFDNKATKSQNRRTHNIRDAGNERNIRSDSSEKSHDSSCYAVETKTPTKKSKTKTRKEISPQEHFLNYINSIITEYMETEEKNQTKIMCTPQNLEDLENFAQLLVSIGIGRVVEEEIRVNRKNNRQAFISLCSDREGLGRDGIVLLPVARRYAFDGDIVRAFVLNPKIITNKNEPEEDGRKTRKISSNILGGKESSICLADDEDLFDEYDSSPDTDNDDSPDITAIISENCPKAFVINIVKQTELREVVGSVSFKKTCTLNSKIYYKLKPHDMKVPMVYIPANSCQDHINAASKDDVVGMLFLAHVLETDVNGRCIGELLHPIGKVGNLEAEMKAILLHNGLKDLKPYDQKFYDMYDGPVPPVTDDDLRQREDLRKICVFTIDPLTARDLDDAVSVEKLSENDYEIGVHISDVSHYLEENSELDNLVKERATSIYLVNEVIHMLPTSLCFRCSLLPGEDKFAFSVFWRWNEKDKTFSEPRFTRTVINSCTQFAYEHAQKIIDYPEESFCRDDFPEILNNFSPDDIKWRMLLLYSISRQLKSKRYDSGALSINNPKLRFSLDPLSGEPISYEVEGRKEANYLIEEFMLLANQAVAKFIHQHFPDISILRNHAPPLQKSMRALRDRLANLDLDFDITSSKSIYESIQRLSSQADDREAMEAALNVLLTKPMARARYVEKNSKNYN